MVTAAQIARLDSRIEALAAALGHGPGPNEYVVRFRFDGESEHLDAAAAWCSNSLPRPRRSS
jgi:hypothetical protein